MMTDMVEPYRHSSCDIVTRTTQETFEDGNIITKKWYQNLNLSVCLVFYLFKFLFLSSGQTMSLRKCDLF